MAKAHPLTLAVLALALASPAGAGAPGGQAGPPPPQPPPVFRAGTDLVEVDVVVDDKKGRFVPDLTAADFELTDDGKARPVDLVTLVRGAASPAKGGQPAAAQPAQGPSAASGERRRVFIAYFDEDHLTPAGFKRVQAAARDLFAKAFAPGDLGGVVVGGQMANKRLTSDRDELLKAIADARPSGKANSKRLDEQEWPRMSELEALRIQLDQDRPVYNAVYQRACTDQPDSCQKMDVESIIRAKAAQMTQIARVGSEVTVQSLSALFHGLSGFAGTKTVLLLTEGFVAEETWPLVEQAVELADRANARVYTLDGRGLDRMGIGDRLAGADPGNYEQTATLLAQGDAQGDAMNSLAVDTGGFVVRNTTNFADAVAHIADEAGTYYLLGFRPGASDGKFHKLSVRVKRPGLAIRARRGYVATVHPSPAIETLLTPIAPSALPGRTDVESAPIVPAAAPAAPAANVAPTASTVPALGSRAAGAVAELRPDAVRHAASLAANAPRDNDATKGWNAYQRGDLESARVSLAAAAAKPGARPWVSYALGQSQYGLRAYQDAATSWERVRSAAPEFEPVYFDLVDAYLQLRDYDHAVGLMRDAAKRWPADADIDEALGVVEVKRRALDDAVASFQQAIAKAPADATGYFNLANALELRYRHSRRWVAVAHRWYENAHDRDAAIDNYKRCVAMGGPFADPSRAALKRLEWDGK